MPLVTPVPPAAQPGTLHVGSFPQLVSTRYTSKDGLGDGPITAIRIQNSRVWAQTPGGWRTLDGSRWKIAAASDVPPGPGLPAGIPEPPGGPVLSAAAGPNGRLLAVTAEGAFRYHGGSWQPLQLPRVYKAFQPVPNIDATVRAVCGDGTSVWIATDRGLYVTDGGDWWHPLDRDDGMPYEDLLTIAIGPNGDLWAGTTQGAWRLRAGRWRYFWGERWIPGNRVSAVAVAPDGSAWLGTDRGVAHIQEQPMTLERKADHYEHITRLRHNRRGYVTGCDLKKPGDPAAGYTPVASDNDGLWTALYVAAESFRYAVTRSPEARQYARESMNALLDLVRLTGVPGFPARTVVRKDEEVHGYNPAETVRIPGGTAPLWFPSPVDRSIICKGDTSSDELDGHYFAWYVYYEHVADEHERAEIRSIVRAVTSNLLDHDYTLVGPTGYHTRWGVFGPQFLNDDPTWFEERGLNSAEMLCYLKVAQHICGDKRFFDAYETLIRDHHYLQNTLNYRRQVPWWALNHSDDELAYCVYYPLLMLEKDPARRAVLLRAVAATWEGGPVTAGLKEERSPFYAFIYGALTGSPCRAEDAVETLEDWPWELIDWPVRNSQRHDVTLRTAPGGRNQTEIDRVLPASERRVIRWNGDPWEPDGGNAGDEEDGAAWLLPYWLGRYHGIIAG